MPIGSSGMAYDVFLMLAAYGSAPNMLSLKRLYLSLGYSHYGVRMHLRRLGREGWIELAPIDGDRRGRSVVLTEKFREVLERYLEIREAVGG